MKFSQLISFLSTFTLVFSKPNVDNKVSFGINENDEIKYLDSLDEVQLHQTKASDSEILSFYISQLDKIPIIKKETLKKHIFRLLENENSNLVQYLAKICHNGEASKISKWSKNLKVKLHKNKTDKSAQIEAITKALKNKINVCTKTFNKQHHTLDLPSGKSIDIEVKSDMDIKTVLDEIFEEIFGQYLDQETLVGEIENVVGRNITLDILKIKEKIDTVVDEYVISQHEINIKEMLKPIGDKIKDDVDSQKIGDKRIGDYKLNFDEILDKYVMSEHETNFQEMVNNFEQQMKEKVDETLKIVEEKVMGKVDELLSIFRSYLEKE